MEPTIYTPRLKLTLITSAERGSQELQWLHEFRSDEQATYWSIVGRSKTLEDTEKNIKGILPISTTSTNPPSTDKPYRIVYAVHELIDSNPSASTSTSTPTPNDISSPDIQPKQTTRFIGIINLKSLDRSNLPLPPESDLPAAPVPEKTLVLELGYGFLPISWAKGYATESILAMFDACRHTKEVWRPYENVYVRALVNCENGPSVGVVRKVGLGEKRVFEWKGNGERVWVGGRWRGEDLLWIFGGWLV